jgi:hypothetical protein
VCTTHISSACHSSTFLHCETDCGAIDNVTFVASTTWRVTAAHYWRLLYLAKAIIQHPALFSSSFTSRDCCGHNCISYTTHSIRLGELKWIVFNRVNSKKENKVYMNRESPTHIQKKDFGEEEKKTQVGGRWARLFNAEAIRCCALAPRPKKKTRGRWPSSSKGRIWNEITTTYKKRLCVYVGMEIQHNATLPTT